MRFLFLFILCITAVTHAVLLGDIPSGFSGHAIAHHQLALQYRQLFHCFAGLAPCPDAWPTLAQQFSLMSVLHGLVFSIFGFGYIQSIAVCAALGIISVWLAYLVGKEIEGPTLGCAFAAFLGAAPWHLTFSRYADAEHILPVAQALLSVYLLLLSVRMNKARHAFIFGIVLGASWYVYGTNQILPPILGAVFFAAQGRRAKWVAFVAAFMLASYPAVSESIRMGFIYPVRSTLPFNDNYKLNSVSDLAVTIPQSLRQLFLTSGDPWFDNHAGAFPRTVSIFGLFGCAAALVRIIKRKRPCLNGFIVGLFVISMSPSFLTSEDSFRRLLLACVMIAFLAGYGLSALIFAAKRFISERAVIAALGVLAAVLFVHGSYSYAFETRLLASEGDRHHSMIAEAAFHDIALGKNPVFVVFEFNDIGVRLDYLEFFAYRDFYRKEDARKFAENRSKFIVFNRSAPPPCSELCASEGQPIYAEEGLIPLVSKTIGDCAAVEQPPEMHANLMGETVFARWRCGAAGR